MPERAEKLAAPPAVEPPPRAARPWQPERVERDEVDAQISQALGVEDPGAYPPPLVPQKQKQGDR